jgi:hypothetical protein
LHDNYYENLRKEFLRKYPNIKSEKQLRSLAVVGRFKRRVEISNKQFKDHMIVTSKRAGRYWLAFPVILVFWKIVDKIGYRVWISSTIAKWEESR